MTEIYFDAIKYQDQNQEVGVCQRIVLNNGVSVRINILANI